MSTDQAHWREAAPLRGRPRGLVAALDVPAPPRVWWHRQTRFQGPSKSYQHYLTVCYRQSGNLVRFEKSARSLKSHDVSRLSAPKTLNMAPERGCERRPGRRIRVRIRYGSYTDPIRFSRIRAFSRVKTYYVWTDPIRPLYPCIILIKGSDGFRGRLPAGGTGQGSEGRRAPSRILPRRSF